MTALLCWMLALAPQAMAQGEESAPIHADAHWNEGVQALQAGAPDRAALSFRKAQLLRPHDAELSAQLAKLGASPETPPLLAPDRSGWSGVAALGLALLSLLLWRLRKRPALLGVALLLGPVGAALTLQAQIAVSQWGSRGLVLSPGATLTTGPASGLELLTLSPTTEVILGPVVDGAVQVETLDGRRGWTSLDAVGVLDPRMFTSPSPGAR